MVLNDSELLSSYGYTTGQSISLTQIHKPREVLVAIDGVDRTFVVGKVDRGAYLKRLIQRSLHERVDGGSVLKPVYSRIDQMTLVINDDESVDDNDQLHYFGHLSRLILRIKQ
jgi:hypothetical protein